MPRYKFTKDELYHHYHTDKLNPYEIGAALGCDHKTIRAWLKKFEIPLREASEYNSLPRMTHSTPSKESLTSHLSIAAHTMYLCEGWHTEKTTGLVFSNQDVTLVNIFTQCIKQVYHYTSGITYQIQFNKMDSDSESKAMNYAELFKGENINFANDPSRKNPIIRIRVGGKNLAREFIANAYTILTNIGTSERTRTSTPFGNAP